MKKLNEWLDRIPRSVRAIFYTLLALALAISYYIALGCPALGMRHEFRRAEKAHMVGLSKIIDTLSNDDYYGYDKLLVGETAHGVCFFGRYEVVVGMKNGRNQTKNQYHFAYCEKTDDITLCAPPNVWGTTWDAFEFKRSLPVYVFTEHSQAVRAEVEVTVVGSTGKNGVGKFTVPFQAEAERAKEGFFRFTFEADQKSSLKALYYLSIIGSGDRSDMHTNDRLEAITAVVRLYDADGTMILEKSVTIFENLDVH